MSRLDELEALLAQANAWTDAPDEGLLDDIAQASMGGPDFTPMDAPDEGLRDDPDTQYAVDQPTEYWPPETNR